MESQEPIVTSMEVLTILAIIIGPIIAVQLSQFLERRRQKNAGKEWVFKTLMRTRVTSLNPSHVEALNMIDVEFHGTNRKNKEVVAAWKLYLDNLGDITTPKEIKHSKRNDLFLDLLYNMAKSLGYDFDKEHIKNTTYVPQSFVDLEREQQLIRNVVIGVLDGKFDIPVSITNLPSQGPQKSGSET